MNAASRSTPDSAPRRRSSEPIPVIAVYQRSVPGYRAVFFTQLSLRLKALGFQLVVLTAEAPNGLGNAGFDYRPLGSRFGFEFAGRDIRDRIVVPRGLGGALAALRPALVVSEDLSGLPGNLAVTWHKLRHGTPYLIWSLGTAILGKERSRIRALLGPAIALFRRNAAGFIAYSSWAARSLHAAYGKPVAIAPNSTVAAGEVVPPDAALLAKYGSMSPFRMVFVGRLLAQKRVDDLLQAMALAGPDTRLDVVGDGPELPRLRARALSLGLGGRVVFHGDVRDVPVKQALMAAAHVAVLPGLGGLFIQEAQARALPVICGPADGTEQDLVRAVTPELYLEHTSPESLARLIERLAADPAVLRRAAAAVGATIRADYNVDTMVERWADAAVAAAQARA